MAIFFKKGYTHYNNQACAYREVCIVEFQYVSHADSDEPIMHLNTHIGNDEEDGPGIDGALFQKELMALDEMGKKRIQIWINSVGGSVIEGYNIFTAILKSKTPVDTYNTGIAASTAGWCFGAGRKKVMADYAILMMHEPSGGEGDGLDKIGYSIATMLSARNAKGKSPEEVLKLMEATTFMTADEAMNEGFCDEIEDTSEQNLKWMRKADSVKDKWKTANKILNKAFEQQKSNKMKLINNKLNLNQDANEESAVAAIEELQNKVTSQKAELDIANKSKADMKEDLDKAKKAYDELKAEYDKMCNEAEEMEDKHKEEKSKEMVNSFVKLGKIKNEEKTLAFWTKLGKEDFEGTKAQLEALPVNKQAPGKIEISSDPDAVPYTAAGVMNKLNSKRLEKNK